MGARRGGRGGANFDGVLTKAFALSNDVKEVVEGFAGLKAEEQKAGVRRDVERRVFQPIICQIHG